MPVEEENLQVGASATPMLGFAHLKITESLGNLDRQSSDPENISSEVVQGKLSSNLSLVPWSVPSGAAQFLPLS